MAYDIWWRTLKFIYSDRRSENGTLLCIVASAFAPKSLLRLEEVLGKAYQQIHDDFTRSSRFHVG